MPNDPEVVAEVPQDQPAEQYKVRMTSVTHTDFHTGKVSVGKNQELVWEDRMAEPGTRPEELMTHWAELHQRELLSFTPGVIEVDLLIWGPQSDPAAMPMNHGMRLHMALQIVAFKRVASDAKPVSSLVMP